MDLGVRSQSDYAADWIAHLEGLNTAPKTVRDYRKRLRIYLAYLGEQGIRLQDVRPRTLDAYSLYLMRVRKLAPRSAGQYISTLRVFYRWLQWQEVIKANVLEAMPSIKTERLLPRPFEEDEIGRLIEAARLDKRPWALAWIEVQYSTGCRISEVLGMTWEDVHLDIGYASVMGKGRKARNVPLGRPAIAALRAWQVYLESKAIPCSSDALVWRSRGGKPWERRVITRMLRDVAQAASVEGQIQSHRLRHSFATHMLDRGEDVRVIQELLGHENIKSTEIYTRVSSARMLRAFRRAHPRA